MDDKDRYIIRALECDGRTSYEALAKKLGMTGMAVKKRIKKLIVNNILFIGAQLNTQELGYSLNLILLEVDTQAHLHEIKSAFIGCPRVINMFTGLGGYNLVVLVLAEDRPTLESELMGNCSLRTREGIRRSEVIQIEEKIYSPFVSIRNSLATRDKNRAPCGIACDSCNRYKVKHCLGCPSTIFYRGDL